MLVAVIKLRSFPVCRFNEGSRSDNFRLCWVPNRDEKFWETYGVLRSWIFLDFLVERPRLIFCYYYRGSGTELKSEMKIQF